MREKIYLVDSPEELAEFITNSIQKILENHHSSPKEADDKLLTTIELCKLLSISRTQAWKLRRQGILPAIRLGNRILYSYRCVLESLTKINHEKY